MEWEGVIAMGQKKEVVSTAGSPQPEGVARKTVKAPRGRVLTRNAGIFKIMGIGESKEPGGFSWRKHELDR